MEMSTSKDLRTQAMKYQTNMESDTFCHCSLEAIGEDLMGLFLPAIFKHFFQTATCKDLSNNSWEDCRLI
jgi:hypothetical protein